MVFCALMMWIASLYFEAASIRLPPPNQFLELAMGTVFVFFQSGMLSFSNSYIQAEQSIVMFMLGMLGFAIWLRLNSVKAGGNVPAVPYIPLILPLLSRLAESFISGHGLDPSIRLYWAHSAAMFLPSLAALLLLRLHWWYRLSEPSSRSIASSGFFHVAVDALTVVFLALGWIEKRNLDQTRNGYLWIRIAIALILVSTPITIYQGLVPPKSSVGENGTKADGLLRMSGSAGLLSRALAFLSKLLLLLMVVTGPAAAPTELLGSIQGLMLFQLCGATGFYEVSGNRGQKVAANPTCSSHTAHRYHPLFWPFYGDSWYATSFSPPTMVALLIAYSTLLHSSRRWNLILLLVDCNSSSTHLVGKWLDC